MLRGGGRYSDDQNRPGQAYGYVVRSPHAHARILSIDTGDALAAPGVLRVYTGEDMADYGSVPCLVPREKADSSPMFSPPNRPLRQERVRYVGDYIAFVVAESHSVARFAAIEQRVKGHERDLARFEEQVDQLAAEAEVQREWNEERRVERELEQTERDRRVEDELAALTADRPSRTI